VLIFLLIALFNAFTGLFKARLFSRRDYLCKQLAVRIVQIQFILGIVLYAISPIVRYFLTNFGEAVHVREIRFFGMEHITVMVIAVGLISVASDKIDRSDRDRDKFRIMAWWFGIALLLILTSIPWSFSPLISRPSFRTFHF